MISVSDYMTIYFITQDANDTLIHTTLIRNPVRFAFRQKILPRNGIYGIMDMFYAIASLLDYSTFALPRTIFNKVLYTLSEKVPVD